MDDKSKDSNLAGYLEGVIDDYRYHRGKASEADHDRDSQLVNLALWTTKDPYELGGLRGLIDRYPNNPGFVMRLFLDKTGREAHDIEEAAVAMVRGHKQ